MSSRQVRVDGRQRDADKLWRWLGTSAFAPTRRRATSGGNIQRSICKDAATPMRMGLRALREEL